MKYIYFIVTLFQVSYGYIYHNHVSVNQPYLIKFKDKSFSDFKTIDSEQALTISSFWYKELKEEQNYNSNINERRNIEYLYESNSDNKYLEMSNMMIFNYDVETESENKYLIWKPRIQPQFLNDDRNNMLFYPCFKQTICLVSFKEKKNSIEIQNIVYSPFWKGDTTIIDRKSKSLIIDYFLNFLNNNEIIFKQ